MSKSTYAEHAFQKIKQDVLTGEFKAGERLNIETLKRRYSIGLTPIREALNRLISLGFVEFTALKGFRVSSVSKSDLKDIYAMRQLIELEALKIALEQGDDRWEAEIVASYHCLTKLELNKQFLRKPDFGEWINRYSDFHFAILSACGSTWLLTIDKILFEQSNRYRYLMIANKSDSWEKLFIKKAKAHKELLNSILARDKVAALRLFAEQLTTTVDELCAQEPWV